MKSSRSFGQGDYDLKRLQIPRNYRGRVYKFTLLLPTSSNGLPRFGIADERALGQLLIEDFGGFTSFDSTLTPAASGEYLSTLGRRDRDSHSLFVIYALQTDEAVTYFRELCRNLERFSRTALRRRLRSVQPDYEGEEQILIEMTAATII